MELAQGVEIVGAKDHAQGLDGKEELGMSGSPALAIVSQRPSRDQGVQVEMRLQELVPGCVGGPTLCKTMVVPSWPPKRRWPKSSRVSLALRNSCPSNGGSRTSSN